MANKKNLASKHSSRAKKRRSKVESSNVSAPEIAKKTNGSSKEQHEYSLSSLLPSSNKIDLGLSRQSFYESYFGLKEKPFKLTPDPRFFYMSKQHQEALAHLVFGIQENKGFVSITGEVGTGKTTLCRSFLNHLDKKIKVAYIFNPCLTDVELLQNINDELGIPSDNESKKQLIDKLNEYLLEEKRQENKVILIVDEAQNLTPTVLEQLRLLSNLETETDKLIQIVLVGQPELENTLSRPDLRQLKQRITINWELLPLGKDDTSSYIKHRTKIAGGNGQLTFSRNALSKIHDYSKGIPRLINVLADRALIIAFALEKKEIDLKIIQYAIKDIEKPPGKNFTKHKFIIRTIIYGLLFLVSLSLGVFLYLTQKGTPPEITKMGTTESDIAVKTKSLPEEIPVPDIDSPLEEVPVLNTDSISEETPELKADIITDKSPLLSTKQDFENILNQSTDQNRINSIAEVLEAWDMPPLPPDELDRVTFLNLKEIRGLSFFEIDADLRQLKIFNYPAILSFQSILPQPPYFLLLIEVQNDSLTFMLNGEKVQITREVLDQTWTGKAYIFWKNFENIDWTISPDFQGFEVVWLSKKLKALGFYDYDETAVFNDNLLNAVLRFQKENNLRADGSVGKETKSIIYNRLGIYKTPQLVKDVGHL